MTKGRLIEIVSEKLPGILDKKDVKLAVNSLFKDMAQALIEGDKVEIRGLGSFKIVSLNGRIGRNPKNGDKVNIPAKKRVHFKPGKELKERVDN